MEPLQLANKGIHEKVIDHFVRMKRGRVLDIPCGPGALSRALDDLGFEVAAGDIHPEIMQVSGIQASYADMNAVLPYEDGAFDYVACVEGIEHTENPYNAMRQIARVLTPGGRLVLTTPNYLNIERRLKFLVTGSFSKPVSAERFRDFFQGDTAGMHNSPMTYPVLKFMLESNGLEILSMEKEKTKRNQVFLLPFTLLIHLYTRLWPPRQRRKYLIDEVNSAVVLQGGNNLILVCEKARS